MLWVGDKVWTDHKLGSMVSEAFSSLSNPVTPCGHPLSEPEANCKGMEPCEGAAARGRPGSEWGAGGVAKADPAPPSALSQLPLRDAAAVPAPW